MRRLLRAGVPQPIPHLGGVGDGELGRAHVALGRGELGVEGRVIGGLAHPLDVLALDAVQGGGLLGERVVQGHAVVDVLSRGAATGHGQLLGRDAFGRLAAALKKGLERPEGRLAHGHARSPAR